MTKKTRQSGLYWVPVLSDDNEISYCCLSYPSLSVDHNHHICWVQSLQETVNEPVNKQKLCLPRLHIAKCQEREQ